MFSREYYKLAILALTIILTACLCGIVWRLAGETLTVEHPAVKEAEEVIVDNMPEVEAANTQLNQYSNIVDYIMNYDVEK